MLQEILFAGFGGQGIMYMGKLLSHTAMKKGYEVTWSSSYGIEVRGGTAKCVVKISDQQIAVPTITSPNTFVAMNGLSLEAFKDQVAKHGLILINTSTVGEQEITGIRSDIQVVKLPFSEIASGAGDERIGNMAALGAYIALKQNFDLQTVIDAMDEMTPPHRRNLLKFNVKALQEGFSNAKFERRNVK